MYILTLVWGLKKQDWSHSSYALKPRLQQKAGELLFPWIFLEQFLGVAKWHVGDMGELGFMNREVSGLKALEIQSGINPGSVCLEENDREHVCPSW